MITKTKMIKVLRDIFKNNLFLSPVTNLNDVRCWSQGGLWCSVRNYHYEDYSYKIEIERERANLNNRYKISLTKDYKNLNNMLSIKGLDSNKLIVENNIRYLVFSLTKKYNLSAIKVGDPHTYSPERDIFYSVSLILMTSGIQDENENKK